MIAIEKAWGSLADWLASDISMSWNPHKRGMLSCWLKYVTVIMDISFNIGWE